MTRGNQREKDRERAQKKTAAQQKGPKQSSQSLANRKEADAAALKAKIEAKAAAKAAAEAGGGGGGGAKKK